MCESYHRAWGACCCHQAKRDWDQRLSNYPPYELLDSSALVGSCPIGLPVLMLLERYRHVERLHILFSMTSTEPYLLIEQCGSKYGRLIYVITEHIP